MKKTPKVVLGIATLALLGGGLAGCGNQSAQTSGQQKAQTASTSNAQYLKHRHEISDEQTATLNDISKVAPSSMPQIQKYNATMTAIHGDVIIHGKCYQSLTFNLYKSAYKNKVGYNYSIPYRQVLKSYWQSLDHEIIKNGLNDRKPCAFVFRYVDSGNDHQSAVYYSLSNSPKLHTTTKNQFKSEGTGSY